MRRSPSRPRRIGSVRQICGSWPASLLQVAADHQVEQLLAAAQFDVGLDLDAVLALHQRVEALVQVDRRAGLERLVKSSRSSMRCTVILLVSASTSRKLNLPNQSPLCVHLGLGRCR